MIKPQRHGGGHRLTNQRFHPFDQDGADHLDDRGGANIITFPAIITTQITQQGTDRRAGITRNQQRRAMASWLDRRHDRHINIGSARLPDYGGGLGLGAGRYRIAIGKYLPLLQKWCKRGSSIIGLISCDNRDDEFCLLCQRFCCRQMSQLVCQRGTGACRLSLAVQVIGI